MLHFHMYLCSFGVVRVLVCNILALFCKVIGQEKKSQFHKISDVALFLPHFLAKMKEMLSLQPGIQYYLTCHWVNLNGKKTTEIFKGMNRGKEKRH